MIHSSFHSYHNIQATKVSSPLPVPGKGKKLTHPLVPSIPQYSPGSFAPPGSIPDSFPPLGGAPIVPALGAPPGGPPPVAAVPVSTLPPQVSILREFDALLNWNSDTNQFLYHI